MEVRQPDAVRGQFIYVRCTDERVAMVAEVAVTKVIRQNQHYVRARLPGCTLRRLIDVCGPARADDQAESENRHQCAKK